VGRKNQPGGCKCCGGSTTYCGPPCRLNACGDVHFVRKDPCVCNSALYPPQSFGTLTDDNGTYPIVFNYTYGSYACGSDPDYTPDCVNLGMDAYTYLRSPYNVCQIEPDAPGVPYFLQVGCGANGKLRIDLHGSEFNCPFDDKGYYGTNVSNRATAPLSIAYSDSEVCTSDSVTGTFSSFDFVSPYWKSQLVNLPITSATVTFNIAKHDTSVYQCCNPCDIPKRNLTVSWANSVFGNGSAPLVYHEPTQYVGARWVSECANQLIYEFYCAFPDLRLEVSYFISGSCPGGRKSSCTSDGLGGRFLQVDSYSCDPFHLAYTVTRGLCPVLASSGYTSFTVTE
jgi:hypothetical protein